MFHSNLHNSSVSTTVSDRQYKAFVLSVIIVGVLSLVLCLGTPARAQSSSRFNIQQIGNALTSYGKNTVNDNGQIYYTVICGHDSWKSNVTVSLSPNSNIIWLQLDLVELPAHASPAALANLLKKNADLGPLFFGINGNKINISSPLPNYDMSEGKLKGYLEQLVNTAVNNHNLWDPRILASAPSPAHGASAHLSREQSFDAFDDSLMRAR
jgi:hypothetical protein